MKKTMKILTNQRMIILLPIFLLSCASGLTKPPSSDFIKTTTSDLSKNPKFLRDLDLNRLSESERQAVVFLSADSFRKSGKDRATCDRLKYLSKDKSFPLRQLALVESFNVCDYSTLKVRHLWKTEFKEVHPAWKKEFLINSMAFAKKNDLKDHYIDFALEYFPLLETRTEKEKFLLKLKKETAQNIRVMQALYELSPRFIPKPKPDKFLEVALDFSRNRQFKQARKYFNKVIASSNLAPKDRLKAYKSKAFSYKLERNKKKYSWELEKVIKWFEAHKDWFKDENLREEYFDLRIQTARAQWTVNYRTRAEKTLSETISHPLCDSKTRANAYFILGKIEVEKKNYVLARNNYELGLDQPEIEDSILEYLSWSLGWSHYLDGNYKLALNVFQRNKKRSEERSFKRKLTFWEAKTLEKLGRTSDANDLYETLMEEDRFGYYGISAAMVLKKPLKLEAPTSYNQQETAYPILNWLITLGRYEEAKAFLKDLQKKHSSTDEIENILPLYHFAQWYEGGIFKFFKIPSEDIEDIQEEHLPAAYPLPHKNIILSEQKRSKLPAAFIYSIARQESAFNPKVRSWADAFGLLQLTPEKAKGLAKKTGVSYKNFSDLYDVQTNVTLGGELLKNLAKRYNGLFIPTVAAYNAGERPVKSWLKERKREDPFEFIEMIPYKETRNYIKLVLRNYATYSRLLNYGWNQSEDFFKEKFFF